VSPDLRLREAALLLAAADSILIEDHSRAEDALAFTRRWEDTACEEHAGDCTDQPYTCLACVLEEYERAATRMDASDEDIPEMIDKLIEEKDEAKAQFWQQRHEWAAATGRNQEMINQLLAALSVIPADRLELLANWLDVVDAERGDGGTEVQADLREMARLSRVVFETE
jgi:hypothetical protein